VRLVEAQIHDRRCVLLARQELDVGRLVASSQHDEPAVDPADDRLGPHRIGPRCAQRPLKQCRRDDVPEPERARRAVPDANSQLGPAGLGPDHARDRPRDGAGQCRAGLRIQPQPSHAGRVGGGGGDGDRGADRLGGDDGARRRGRLGIADEDGPARLEVGRQHAHAGLVLAAQQRAPDLDRAVLVALTG
jgi:hypothetical protein